ncbi:MAG: tetratricopeptide repeat protein [Deltaproteobacteria bacterium]|nr:tetratricopeptide repeat protein [Deltaproteobacteria bacterium]
MGAALIGCQPSPRAPAPKAPTPSVAAPAPPTEPAAVEPPPMIAAPPAAVADAAPRPLRRCFDTVPVWVDAPVPDLLDRAEALLQTDDAEGALACAEEACRQAPRSVDAHQDRASALLRLGRIEAAREAITLVLAIAPTDPSSLLFAADLFINHLPATTERASIGLEYVRRAGRSSAAFRARSGLLEGQALIDLGRAADALRALTRALQEAKTSEAKVAITYELGVAMFELARFSDAQARLAAVLEQEPNHAQAHFHMGLVLERAGEMELAEQHFAAATAADATAFPPRVEVAADAFAEQVREAVSQLPGPMQESLRDVPVEAAELPTLEDLTAESPPLSPTILGLFRGLPLGRVDDGVGVRLKNVRTTAGRGGVVGASVPPSPASFAIPERGIVIYRRNLLRSVRGVAEVQPAIVRTLLHEAGHLLGEDDGSLRDRGLE